MTRNLFCSTFEWGAEKSHAAQTGEWFLIPGLKNHSCVLPLAVTGSAVSRRQAWACGGAFPWALLWPRCPGRRRTGQGSAALWAVKACCEGCEHPSVTIAFKELAKGRGKLARCSSDFFPWAALGGGEGKDSFLTAKLILCLKFEYPLPLTKTLLLKFLQNNISLFHMHWRVPLHSKLQWMYPEQSWKVIAVIIVCHLLLSQTFSSPVNK